MTKHPIVELEREYIETSIDDLTSVLSHRVNQIGFR